MSEHPAFLGRDVLSIDEFSREELLFIMEQARLLEHDESRRAAIRDRLYKRPMYFAFFEPSTRTRFSFIYAARSLGLWPKGFSNPSATSAKKGEPLKDTLRMAQGYGAEAIVLRHPLAGAALWGAENTDIPLINAGDGAHEHPTQTFLDLYSILTTQFSEQDWTELKDLRGLTVSFVGDLKYGRTVHSLTKALARFRGLHLRFVAPDSLQIPDEYLEKLSYAGVSYSRHERIEEVIGGTDILYMTRIQRERFPDEREYERVRRIYHLTADHLRNARPSMRVMHPLPRNKNALELDFSVDDTPHAYYYQQAAHGVTVRAALLALVMGGIETPRYERTSPLQRELKASLHPMPMGGSRQGKPRPEFLFSIKSGTVLDHIPPKRSSLVKSALKIPEGVSVLVAENLESRKMPGGRKDLIKIIDFRPSAAELNQIALVAPDTTICLIEDEKLVEKSRVQIPDQVRDLLTCINPSCISRPEHREGVPSLFLTTRQSPPLMTCYFCDARLRQEDFRVASA